MTVDLSISEILETLVSKQVDEKVSTPVAVQPALLKIDAACEYLAIGKSTPTYNNESIRSSYGFGFNYYSPIGPIGFSWGFPLTDEPEDIKRMFTFSIGYLN